MWRITSINMAVLQRSLVIPFLEFVLNSFNHAGDASTWAHDACFVLEWTHGSTTVFLLISLLISNGHIHFCLCGLTLCHSLVYRWSRRPWLGSIWSFYSLVVKYNTHHTSQPHDFLIDASTLHSSTNSRWNGGNDLSFLSIPRDS